MHRGQEEARERTAQAMERKRDSEGNERTAIADKVTAHLKAHFDKQKKELRPPVIHWDDCDMDCHTFWFHLAAKEEDVLSVDYSKNLTTSFRRAVKEIDLTIAAPSPYELRWELAESPRKLYHEGLGPARHRISGVSQSHWVYKLHIQG